MRLALLALCAALIFGCSGETATCELVDHDGDEYCVYRGPITETGYVCPAEMPNMHRDEQADIVICSSDQERPPFEDIAAELEEPPDSNDPNLTLPPEEREECIEQNADGTMLSDVRGCYGYFEECELVDYEAETRASCTDEGGEGCDEPFITRDAAICITRAVGLEVGEWPETASLTHNVMYGPIWAVSVLREVVDDGAEGEGDVWFVDAHDGAIVEMSGFGWINGGPSDGDCVDLDGDGFGTGSDTERARCPMCINQGQCAADCNDNDAAINPGRLDICDGTDNDCDSEVDEPIPCESRFDCPDESPYLPSCNTDSGQCEYRTPLQLDDPACLGPVLCEDGMREQRPETCF